MGRKKKMHRSSRWKYCSANRCGATVHFSSHREETRSEAFIKELIFHLDSIINPCNDEESLQRWLSKNDPLVECDYTDEIRVNEEGRASSRSKER